jgi:hypothetical protein
MVSVIGRMSLRRGLAATLVAALALMLPTAQVRQLSASSPHITAASAHAEHGTYSTDLTHVALMQAEQHGAAQQHATTSEVRTPLTPYVRPVAAIERHLPTASAYPRAHGARAPPAAA